MKKLFVLTLFFPVIAGAHQLSCWKTDFTPKTPFMTATIGRSLSLVDIQFNYKDPNDEVQSSRGAVAGKLITSNHSPYKNQVDYTLANGADLVLPQDLSNASLQAVFQGGIGYYKQENGAIFGNYADGDSEGGNHYSIRLHCYSDL